MEKLTITLGTGDEKTYTGHTRDETLKFLMQDLSTWKHADVIPFTTTDGDVQLARSEMFDGMQIDVGYKEGRRIAYAAATKSWDYEIFENGAGEIDGDGTLDTAIDLFWSGCGEDGEHWTHVPDQPGSAATAKHLEQAIAQHLAAGGWLDFPVAMQQAVEDDDDTVTSSIPSVLATVHLSNRVVAVNWLWPSFDTESQYIRGSIATELHSNAYDAPARGVRALVWDQEQIENDPTVTVLFDPNQPDLTFAADWDGSVQPAWKPPAPEVPAEPVIALCMHTDDWAVAIGYPDEPQSSCPNPIDAVAWFAQASDEAILKLAKDGFGGSYSADRVGDFLEDTYPEVAALHAYLQTRRDTGYEVYVDEVQARAWIKANRPSVWAKLQEED